MQTTTPTTTAKATTAKATTTKATPAQGTTAKATTAQGTTAKATTAQAATAKAATAKATPAPSHTTPTGTYVVIHGNAKQIEDLFLDLTPYQGDGDITVFAGPDSSPLTDGSDTPQGIMALFLAAPVPVTAGVCQKLAADHPDLHIIRVMRGNPYAMIWHHGKVGVETLDGPLFGG